MGTFTSKADQPANRFLKQQGFTPSGFAIHRHNQANQYKFEGRMVKSISHSPLYQPRYSTTVVLDCLACPVFCSQI